MAGLALYLIQWNYYSLRNNVTSAVVPARAFNSLHYTNCVGLKDKVSFIVVLRQFGIGKMWKRESPLPQNTLFALGCQCLQIVKWFRIFGVSSANSVRPQNTRRVCPRPCQCLFACFPNKPFATMTVKNGFFEQTKQMTGNNGAQHVMSVHNTKKKTIFVKYAFERSACNTN